MKKIFLICPVRKIEHDDYSGIEDYVSERELAGDKVYWPARDTRQDDLSGGYEICRSNFHAILKADEVHIWYKESSYGSKFDMGGVFMLVEMLGHRKKIVIVNRKEAIACDYTQKSFLKVMDYLTD